MKKKIVSFLKNSHIQYFALGTVLAVVISFSLSAVFAQTNSTIYKFIQPDNGLVNRIGSLSVNRGSTASWINPKGWHSGNRDGKRETCLTTYGLSDKNEVESCLDVNGIGAFSKIITLDIPTFIYPTLFLNDSANFTTTSGLPSGLIIEDDPNTTNDSILAAGLQYTNANGLLAPRDLTSKRNLCADKTTGELYPCGGTISYSCTGVTPDHAVMCQGDNTGLTADVDKTLVAACGANKCEYICDTSNNYHYDANTQTCVADDTYHWETGAWGVCSAATEASCDGGQWNTGDCTIHFEYDGVAPGTQAWGYINQASRDAINNGVNDVHVSASSLSDCRNQAIHMCDGFPASDNPVTENYGCSAFDQQNYEVHYGTNPSYQATIHNCSDINPGDKNTCEAQNDGHTCTWTPAGQSTSTRNVWCEDQNGNHVADSNCDASTKPDSTVGCVNACYTGEYGRNDTNHPDGGQVTYTKIDGNSYTKYHLYQGEKTHITYKRGTTPQAVIAHATRCDTGNGSPGNPVGCDQACGGSTGNYCSGTNGSWTLECQGPSSGEPVTGSEEGTCAWYKYNQSSNTHEWANC